LGAYLLKEPLHRPYIWYGAYDLGKELSSQFMAGLEGVCWGYDEVLFLLLESLLLLDHMFMYIPVCVNKIIAVTDCKDV
jgi:hypothetical protein